MFFGTTPQIVSQYLHKEMQLHSPKRIFIPFSGNFVCEQLASLSCPGVEVHSTDVSIYSRAIGFGVNNVDFVLNLRDTVKEDFKYLSEKREPIEKAAIVIMFSEIAKAYSKKDKIKYYANLYNDAIANQEKYFEKVLSKLIKFRDTAKFHFYGIDACEVLKNVRSGDFVFYDPPVLLGDYEKMFESLKDCLEFEEVDYTQMTEDLKLQQIKEMHEKGVILYWRTNDVRNDVPAFMQHCFYYRYKWNGAYCIYSNAPKNTFVGTFEPLKEAVKNIKIISESDVITENSEIEVILQPSAVGNHYRMMWVKKAQMTSAGWSFLVMVDKKLIGVLQIESGIKFGTDYAIIYSDPAAPTSRYKRLSRLILHICATEQMLKVINDLSMWAHTGFTTRVFTNNPVSMKYRGIFELTDRKEVNDSSNYKYCLIYHSKKLEKTFKDGLKQWLKKNKD